ncbi:MAG: SagB/ThcOx family dehydrogenase [Syntrophorhabdales bacterium]|jgi:SagB-type dehydrogenase family enzyme
MTREIRLPKVTTKGPISLEETLNERRSVRDYKAGSLRLVEVSQLLWAASGGNLYHRTAPSAGATYPLETYVAAGEVEGLDPALYRYLPSGHILEVVRAEDVRRKLSRAARGQRMISRAPIDIVIAAEYERTAARYGQRAIRYVHMEAGHVGQNISLQALALGLGAVMVGAFDDKEVKEVLGIREESLYIIPVGRL